MTALRTGTTQVSKSRVLLLGSYAPSLVNFRGPLIAEMVRRGHHVIAAAPEIDVAISAQLQALGAESVSTPLARTGMNPLHDLAYLGELAGVVRRLRPDMLIAYTAKPVIWGSLAARRVGTPKVAAMITGLGYAFTDGGEARRRVAKAAASFLYRGALKRCDHILFQNPDDRDLFQKLGLIGDPSRASLVNGSGVDVGHYLPAPLRPGPRFLMIARLLVSKGVREYARAATELKRRYPAASFQLAGWIDPSPDGIPQTELDGWIGQGLEYLGQLDDVRPALAASAVYVLPSYREGTPRSVLEAMAIGRPVITTDAPGCRETVVQGVNGLLVPPRDAEALKAAMERFILHPEQIAPMGEQSLRMVAEKYDVHRVNDQILAAVGLGR